MKENVKVKKVTVTEQLLKVKDLIKTLKEDPEFLLLLARIAEWDATTQS